MSFVVNDLIQVLKLAVVLNSLGFVTFHFMLHGVEMAMLSLNIGTFGNTFVAELLCFHRLLVKKFLSSSDFVLETTTDSLFLVDLEFEILELAALVANVAALSVDNESGVVLVASLIIGEHPVAVLKRVDFVVDTLVVTLRDEVDDAAGIPLTEEYGGRSFDDLDTFYVVKIMRDVAKHTVTHDVINLETAHRETTLRSVLVSRHAHAAEAGVTRGGRRVPEQIGQRAGVGIFEEFFRKHRDI